MLAKLALEEGDRPAAARSLAEAADRRARTGSYAPENPYERAVLAWNEELAAELRAALPAARAAEGRRAELSHTRRQTPSAR